MLISTIPHKLNHLVKVASAADSVTTFQSRLSTPLDEFPRSLSVIANRLPHFALARFRVALRLFVFRQRVGTFHAFAHIRTFRLPLHANGGGLVWSFRNFDSFLSGQLM